MAQKKVKIDDIPNGMDTAESLFLNEKIPHTYMKLSIPLVASMVVTLIYNLADTFFVAQTDNTALVAGVSLGAPIFTFLMALGNIFGQGGSSLISRLLGQGDRRNVRKASSFCFWTTIILGIIIAFFMLLLRNPLLAILGATDETWEYAMDYFIPLASGAPFVMLSFSHSNLLRSEGLSKESMTGTILGALVNIVLDPLMISSLGLGAGGAAIATVIGYIASDAYFAVIVKRKSSNLSMDIKQIRICTDDIRQIILIGIPAAISNMMQSFTAIMNNQMLLPYGNDKIAAMGIALKVSMIALLIITGFAFGGQPMFGYYYGLGDRKRMRKLFSFTMAFIIIIATLLAFSVFASAPFLMSLFMDDPAIVSDGSYMLRLQVVTMPLVGIILLMTIIFQSVGKASGSFILSISRQGIVFLLVLMILGRISGYWGILCSQAAADILTVFIAAILFRIQLRKLLST